MSAQQQALLPFACAGTLMRLPVHHEQNLDLDITPYFCFADGKPALHEIDSTGKEWSHDDLRQADAAAFRDRYHRLGPDLRARIARDGESVPQVAEVWLATPLDADQKLPPKPQFLALGKAEQKSIIEAHNAAIAARGRKVAATIQSVAPGSTVDPESFAFHGEGPLLRVEAVPADLRAIGDQDGILDVGLSLRADEDQPASSRWFHQGQFDVLQYLGVDGDNLEVADVLGSDGPYDTRHLGAASGTCQPPFGPDYDCKCAAASPHSPKAGHMQYVMSVIKNTYAADLGGTLPSGAAQNSLTLAAAGGGGYCGNLYIDTLTTWAVNEGATVINRSGTNDYPFSRYLDCLAEGYGCSGAFGYPTVVAATGNTNNPPCGASHLIASHVRNGLVVGGADDNGYSDRTHMTTYSNGCWVNTDSAELPHLVAPAVGIDVVDTDASNNPQTSVVSGTSFATPQVSGAVASLQEYDGDLKTWPEAVVPVMLVSAFDATNPGGPDGTPLDLDDNIDAKDGAGLLAATEAWEVVYSGRKYAGNAPSARGFAFGSHSTSDWPQYNYTNAYFASVAPGAYLRVASFMLNHPTCGSDPATYNNCTGDTFPTYFLHVYNTDPNLPYDYWFSVSDGNNYKYLMIHNTYSTTQTFGINLYMSDWNTMSYDTYGVAWDSKTQGPG